MIPRRRQLYIAYENQPDEVYLPSHDDLENCVAELQPEDAAEYLASLLNSLKGVAARAKLRLLCDLLSVAEEEAKQHVPPGNAAT